MLQTDRDYFIRFARGVQETGLSPEDYYLRNQLDHTGGSKAIKPHELTGLRLARRFVEPEDSCLIVGCGAGAEVQWLQEAGLRRITGLDASEALLHQCRDAFGVEIVCADMRDTGLEAQSFDTVLTHRSLHHLFYPFRALEEMARVARRTVVVANEPVRALAKQVARRLRGRGVISGDTTYEYQFDRDDVHRYMAFHGFELVAERRYWEVPRPGLPNKMLNLAPMLGNRFTAVYRRMAELDRPAAPAFAPEATPLAVAGIR